MKKILGTLLILTNIVIFSGCILNEDEKFNPVALKIESTDLTQTTRDEYTIPAGRGDINLYKTKEKKTFFLIQRFEGNRIERFLDHIEN